MPEYRVKRITQSVNGAISIPDGAEGIAIFKARKRERRNDEYEVVWLEPQKE